MLMNLNIWISLMLFFMSYGMYMYMYKHMLLTIISLEFLNISMIYNFYLIIVSMQISFHLILFMMIITVCEGVLALSLIVVMVRFFGNDYTKSLMVLLW